MPADDGSPIAEAIVEQAVEWHVRLGFGAADADTRRRWEQWLGRHAEHARAWQRVQRLHGHVAQAAGGPLSPELAREALGRANDRRGARRRFARTLGGIAAGGGLLYAAQAHTPWRGTLAAARADIRTAVGEQRRLVLADGSRVLLNTATAIDVRYTDAARGIVLHAGEIRVETAPDPARRPMQVRTAQGRLVPLGTVFGVRRDADGPQRHLSRVAVQEGAVRIEPAAPAGQPQVVPAGYRAAFTRDAVAPLQPLDDSLPGWHTGRLTAQATPLDRFVAELARYHPAPLHADPALAQWRVTGSWPLGEAGASERVLQTLEDDLPVRVTRLLGYWTRVVPR